MKERGAWELQEDAERAILVGLVDHPVYRSRGAEGLSELALLAESAGAVVVERIFQGRRRIDPAYFIGKGKAEELAWLVEERNAQLVLFDDDLSPVQLRNLERLVNRKILDRSALILDIFAARARTSESKTQVELAQLQYMLPRLTRQWTHLSKQYGGIGTKGPGETQIETDRRVIRSRISHLRTKLSEIARERTIQRKGREQFPRVSLVGYTNAGKSTLLNWFSGAGVLVENRLFATLDSTVRLVRLSPAHTMLLSDTVGFIRKLPHHLVASFQSTLDELREADLLLHVVDVSHPLFEEQISVVNDTLAEIGAQGKPSLLVFNKIDLLTTRTMLGQLKGTYENAVFISAARSINMTSVVGAIEGMLEGSMTEMTVTFGQEDYGLISRIHSMAEILEKRYEGDAIILRFRMPASRAVQIRKVLAHTTRAVRGHVKAGEARRSEIP